jgi:hypothetical protein
VNRAEDLRADYDLLGQALLLAVQSGEGTQAASIARERRLIGEKLAQLEPALGVSFVDELSARRTVVDRPPARRSGSN